ncbi:MarR family winged helix-turn-helix transcriptional regulator [Dolosicoccus paucivorans]|uniref:HTH marR-type domain-containing protein n=1 Tax=Dolosicoccus paucivorans TaxID=84521 RepID=A0A2N6SQ02_9LACT|nr:hypothetical protein [Dolosicoccus paucivorans]PMC59140.1 hypothetical protein CJ205_00080 [Dolosicoccus paucivorans]
MDMKYMSKYLAASYRLSRYKIQQTLPEGDIKFTHADILMYLNEHPGSIQKDIAIGMAMDPTLLGRDLTYLENQGYVKRKCCDDQRARAVFLTKEGKVRADQIEVELCQWWHDFFKVHDEIEGSILSRELGKMYCTLRDDVFGVSEDSKAK